MSRWDHQEYSDLAARASRVSHSRLPPAGGIEQRMQWEAHLCRVIRSEDKQLVGRHFGVIVPAIRKRDLSIAGMYIYKQIASNTYHRWSVLWTAFAVFCTTFIIVNTEFIIFNAEFIICDAARPPARTRALAPIQIYRWARPANVSDFPPRCAVCVVSKLHQTVKR